MKIALVSPYDYPYPGAVTEHITHLASEFQRLGHEAHIVAPSSDRAPQCSVPFHRVGRAVSLPMNGSIARVGLPRLTGEVKAILSSGGDFDIVHLHEPLVPGLPLAVLRASKTTNVGTFHAFRHSTLAYLYAKPLLQYFFRKLHGKIAVSTCARDFVADHFHGDYRVIPNGVDFEDFQRERPPIPELRDGKLNVLFVGRLEKRKGLSYLLRAWGTVKSSLPDARLVVVGGGRGLSHYRKFVQDRGLADIVFTGFVSDEDKVRYYQTADVFCAPATGQESFGIVLLEAMAAGKPIVASDIPGYRDVVADGKQALLVPPKSPEALAAALTRLLADGDLRARLGAEGQQTAGSYAWERVAPQILQYYKEVRHRWSLLKRLRRPRFRRVRKVASGVWQIEARALKRLTRFGRVRKVASGVAHLLAR